MTTLQQQFESQHLPNDYQLVNGVAMHIDRLIEAAIRGKTDEVGEALMTGPSAEDDV